MTLSRLSDLTTPFPAAGLLGVSTTVGTGQGTVQDLATAITPLLATIPLTKGGTGAITAAAARTALQIVPNPTAVSTDTLEKILIGTTVYRHGHPHKGVYDATAIYQQGDIIETGTGINSIFWIAREVISAGQGEPAQR